MDSMRHYINLVEGKLFELADAVKLRLRSKFKQEHTELTDQQINYYLDLWDRFVGSFPVETRDITRLTFQQVKQLVDDAVTMAELRGKGQKQASNNTADDMIYNQNNLVIQKGDLREKCVRYGDGYTWCISRKDASNMFYSYRMRMNEPMFYFVFDKSRPTTDIWHAVVIYVDSRGIFHVATSNNPGDVQMTWDQIVSKQPKLNGLQGLFTHLPLTTTEREDYNAYGKQVSEGTYKNFSLREKYKYIRFGHVLSKQQQADTPDELIAVYAKLMPSRIDKSTWHRLSFGDKKYVLSLVEQISDDNEIVKFIVAVSPDAIVLEFCSRTAPRAFLYASSVLKNTWSGSGSQYADIAEKNIAEDAERAYFYSIELMKKPWSDSESQYADKAEQTIAFSPEYAYSYAIWHSATWPEINPRVAATAEQTIAQSSEDSYHYAKNFGRFIAGEPAILQDPAIAYKYWSDVMAKNWPEFDDVRKDYENILIQRFIEHNNGSSIDGDYVVLTTHKDLTDLAEDYGLDKLKYYSEKVEEGYIDVEVIDPDKSAITSILDEKTIEKLRKHVYGDKLSSGDMDQDEYDDTNMSDIINDSNGDIEYAIDSAIREGYEAGALGQIYDAIDSWMNENSHYVRQVEGGAYQVEFPTKDLINEIVELLDSEEDDEDVDLSFYNVVSDFSTAYLGDLDEPYYGFSGWSDEAALDRFKEEIRNFLTDDVNEGVSLARLRALSGIT